MNKIKKMLNIKDELPLRVEEETLNSIVKQLQDQGIDAKWDDFMDVS